MVTNGFLLKNFSRCIIKIKQRRSYEKNKKSYIAIAVIASVMSVLMYVSYIPQIYGNLHGEKGNPTQPLVAMINCIFGRFMGYMETMEKHEISPLFC